MHSQYILAVATVLTTVSSFPHFGAGKRQLNGYEDAPDPSTGVSTGAYSLTEAASSSNFPTLSTGLYGTNPSGLYPTGTSDPTGTSPSGTGAGASTGTGSIGPTSTGSLPPFANITSGLSRTPPDSTGGTFNPSSGLPISALPTSLFPTAGTGASPPISGSPTVTKPHQGHGPVSNPSDKPKKTHSKGHEKSKGEADASATDDASEYGPLPTDSAATGSAVTPNLIVHPLTTESDTENYGPVPTGSLQQSATTGDAASTACAPRVTITHSSTDTVTVTVTQSGSTLPTVSIAPFSSAPYPIAGNGTLGYPTGATGTGALPVGTGTGLPILPTSSTDYIPTDSFQGTAPSSVVTQSPVQEGTSSQDFASVTASASLQAHT